MRKQTQKEKVGRPQSLSILAGGITNSRMFIRAMSLLMGDLATGAVSPGQGNAISSGAAKILKCVELEQRYGKDYGKPGIRVLNFDGDAPLAESLPAPKKRR